MKFQSRAKSSLGKNRLCAAVITLSFLVGAPSALAATITLDYSLSGGATFYTASGTAAATVNYTVLGAPHSQLMTGSASGATSWNIAGDMQVTVDDTGNLVSQPNLHATRRAGVINLDFPVLDLGGLWTFSLDGTVTSADGTMDIQGESAVLINDTDWSVGQLYYLPYVLGSTVVIRILSHDLPNPQLLLLENGTGQSSATLATTALTSTSASFLNFTDTPGCQLTGILGNCLASVDSIVYDFSGVSLAITTLPATGYSSTLLPTIVPIPMSVWLLGSGLLGLIGMARRR